MGALVYGRCADACMEKRQQASGLGPRDARICPLIGPRGAVGPTWLAEWVRLVLWASFIALVNNSCQISSALNPTIKLTQN